MSNGLAGQEFPKGLALIYVSQVPLPGPNPEDYETLKKPLTLSGQIVEVPIGTKYVHIAVVAMDMLFGTLSDTIAPSKLGRIGFEVILRPDSNDLLAEGKYKFDFKALLQDGPGHTPTGKWSCHFWLEIMCFGDIP